MALICVNSGRMCDGCMACQTVEDLIRCDRCHEELDPDDIFEDDAYENLCFDCLVETHRKRVVFH